MGLSSYLQTTSQSLIGRRAEEGEIRRSGVDMTSRTSLRVYGARQHNLQNIDVEFPRGVLTVLTGPSGSGKSSLAFDTVYAEGQRRYVESLSAYARQFLEQLPKPDVDRIEGLPPTVAIEQRVNTAGPRSTVATTTEIHDYLRVLFARVGEPRCWVCDRPITKQSTAQMVDAVLSAPEGQRVMVLSPLIHEQRGGHQKLLERVLREGFVRARIDGQVLMIEDAEPLSPTRKHDIDMVVDRLVVKPGIAQRLADSIETAARLSGGRVIIAAQTDEGAWSDTAYSAALACPVHAEVKLDHPTPPLFSFNAPQGACEHCNGLGIRLELDPELIVPNPQVSLADGAIAAWRRQGRRLNALYAQMIREFCERFGVLPDAPFRHIPESKKRILLHGTTDEEARQFGVTFEGVMPNLKRRWETTDSESAKQRLHAFQSEAPCEHCHGTRLNPRALCVKLGGRGIAEITALTVQEAATFFQSLALQGEAGVVGAPLIREIRQRLQYLVDVGVDYLTLDRASATLSGGEWQRIRLGTQIGGSLAGVCYVLDEPTIGLHPRDTKRLIAILQQLADMDNTVLVVEHDEEVIAAAEHLIDMGPGAGARGGRIVAQGTLADVLRCKESITGRFLSGESRVAVPEKRRPLTRERCVELRGVSANNLKGLDVTFPLGGFLCVTGVSGSGKSTLVTQVLLPALKRHLERGGPRPGAFEKLVNASLVDQVIEIDQSPIGRTPRSNPATYVGAFNLIRDLFGKTREAKIRGYGGQRFSFNVAGGRCEVCEGQGTRRVSMHFLPNVFVTCGECGGSRYNRETLEVRYRGKSIADVLGMSVEEAVSFFDNFANVRRRLQALKDVGLGYMSLGQPSNTLSGGEAQRVKLAAELHRASEGHTMYILDEPTTGLHFADVRNLITLLNKLVDRGHTVIIIEHNLDMIKVADWIIDLGPEGGDAGGSIVVEGPPETVAACERSHTGEFLRKRLNRAPALSD